MLLNDLVAAKPVPVIPIPALPLEVAQLGEVRILRIILLAEPDAVTVPIAIAGHELADVAALNALHRLEVTRLVPALGAGDHGEFLCLRQTRALDDRANPHGIDRHRFLNEHVLPSGDRRRKMQRAETGRCRQDHHVDTGREDFLVGIETREPLRLRDVQLLLRRFDLPREQVAQGHDLDARRRIEAVLRGTGAAATATDDADADTIGTGDRTINPGSTQPRQHGGTGGDRGHFHKIATRDSRHRRSIHWDWLWRLTESEGNGAAQ